MWQRIRNPLNEKPDVHTKLMKAYKEVPQYWFLGFLGFMIGLAILACEYYNDQLQLRWWGVLFACAIALFFTLPLGVIAATTNQVIFIFFNYLQPTSWAEFRRTSDV
jgi:hypothetical protein